MGERAACLEGLLDQTVAPWEIIVVNNRSTDRTLERVRAVVRAHPAAPIKVIEQSAMQGLVPTRNMGFHFATGTILGRIDADTIVDADWIEHVIGHLAQGQDVAVTGPVGYWDLPLAKACRTVDDITRRSLLALSHGHGFLFGSNMAITAAAWQAIASDTCPDHEDRFHEDIDLSIHLRDAGLPIGYVSTMRAAISARRIGTGRESFDDYTRRFDRTYAAHRISKWYLNIPGAMLRAIHPGFRRVYQRCNTVAPVTIAVALDSREAVLA
jgi:glycosyltransferase involved in cell wall biosynthesis